MRSNVRSFLTRSAAAIVTTVALTGCLKMDMDMKVSSSEKVSGSVIVGFSDQAIAAMGQKPADFSKEMMKEANTSVKDPKNALPKDAKVDTKAYSKGGFTGVQTTFSNIPISELGKATGAAASAASSAGGSTSSSDTFKIEKKGDSFYFTGSLDTSSIGDIAGGGSGGSSSGTAKKSTAKAAPTTLDPQMEAMISAMGKPEIRFSITFPGTVTKHNGKLSGKTVTWNPGLGSNITMSAVGKTK
jgi:hypothetical protein